MSLSGTDKIVRWEWQFRVQKGEQCDPRLAKEEEKREKKEGGRGNKNKVHCADDAGHKGPQEPSVRSLVLYFGAGLGVSKGELVCARLVCCGVELGNGTLRLQHLVRQ